VHLADILQERRATQWGEGGYVTTRQVIGILLIVFGLVSLIWGGISWTREETVLDLGPIEATKRERKAIPIPPIVGGLLLAGGVVLLVVRPRRKV
jgi:hypothetical protein